MNKKQFSQLVRNYDHLESSRTELDKLVVQYPFSHPVRMLSVKSNTGLPKRDFQKQLAMAAFYTTDRTVLRTLIETGKVPADLKVPSTEVKKSQLKKTSAVSTNMATRSKKEVSSGSKEASENLRQEVLHNLEEMLKSKNEFLRLIEEEPGRKTSADTSTSQTDGPVKATSVTKTKKKASPKEKTSVKASKAVKKTLSKSQNEIIDHFIATEPTITPNKEVSGKQSDLSRPSSELKEDLVSENLAEIFARQGKTTKAIEIYKKLIWQFPQKKASFAARIEELKKK